MSISDSHVPHVLQNYSAVTGPVCLILPITTGGFSGARIWKVEAECGNFALRLWPVHGPDTDRLRQLHRLLAQMSADGAHFVAGPCHDHSGETISSDFGGRWQLEPWLPGRPLRQAEYDIRQIESACLALANWHIAAAIVVTRADHHGLDQRLGRNQGTRWFQVAVSKAPSVRERLKLAREWSPRRFEAAVCRWHASVSGERSGGKLAEEPGESEFSQIAQCLVDHGRLARETHLRIMSELEHAASEDRRLQPCLRDVWSDHILFDREKVTGIIDPAAARTDAVATDLARLLGSVAQDHDELWEAGLESYTRCCGLNESDRRLIRVLDRSAVLLSPITWLLRLQNGRVRPDQTQHIVVRLQSLVERHRNMVLSNRW